MPSQADPSAWTFSHNGKSDVAASDTRPAKVRHSSKKAGQILCDICHRTYFASGTNGNLQRGGNGGSALFCAEVFCGGLGSAANVQFLEDVCQVIANRPGSDIHFLRDLFV